MMVPTFSHDPMRPVVLDTGVVINLNATGYASEVLRALPNSVVITNIVVEDLERGHGKGRSAADLLGELVATGVVMVESLDSRAEIIFESLVSGGAADTLDDGEAATIAYATAHESVGVIDEKKAIIVCERRLIDAQLVSTVDLLRCDSVASSLGTTLPEAVFRALQTSNMNVPRQHIEWVQALIGAERAMRCSRLRRAARVHRM
jgi:predicted nucleic acid-binding protein